MYSTGDYTAPPPPAASRVPPPPPPSQESSVLPPPPPSSQTDCPPPPPPPPAASICNPSDDYDPFSDESCQVAASSSKASLSAPPPPRPPPTILDAKTQLENERAKQNEERLKHNERIAAENKKKRKFSNGRRSGGRLLDVSHLFEQEDNNKNEDGASNRSSKSVSTVDDNQRCAQLTEVVDDAQFEIILKTSAFLFDNQNKIEELKASVRNNPSFEFLFNPQSPGGLKFKQEMDKLLRHRESGYVQTSIPSAPAPPPMTSFQPPHTVPSTGLSSRCYPSQQSTTPINSQSSSTHVQMSGNEGVGKVTTTRVRKSRWGPSVTQANPPTQSLSIAPVHSQPQACGQPLPQIATMNPTLRRQIQEQKEMQMLEKRIRDAAASQLMASSSASSQSAGQLLAQDRLAHYKELAVFDDESAPRDTIEDAEHNNGVIEDGTWEHRKRAKEMLATAMKNDASALLSSGKHHIADFLPKEELDKFLKKSQGEVSQDEGPNADRKIDGSNIGYQMLERGGWAEGKGLGNTSSSTSSGVSSIVNPIAATQSTSGLTGAGVGVKAEHEVAAGDDEFDSYRKRMMLSYRFRPNPLNNPRRDYY